MTRQDDLVQHIESRQKINKILAELSVGKFQCIVDVPNYRKVKAEIVGVDFRNIIWRPIEVHFLEGMEQEIDEWCYDAPFGWTDNDYPGHTVKVKRKYEFDFVSVDQIEFIK